jgi:aspartate/methionine/tyrosine aminotransferase
MTDHVAEVQRRSASNADLAVAAPPLVGRFDHDLATDQPTRALAASVLDEVTAGLRAGQTHYVDVPGIGELRELLAAHLTATGRYDATAAGTVVTAGVQEARFLTVQVLSETFTRVALPSVVHPGMRQALGVRAPAQRFTMACDAENGYLVPVAEVERALAAGADLVVLESPVRLTGAAYDAAAVRRIAEALQRHDAHAIWDEGFAPWSESAPPLAHESAAAGRVTAIGEAFPGAGLEAWSLGYIATQPERVAGFAKLKQIMSICTSTPAQLAAIALAKSGNVGVAAERAELAALRGELVAAATADGVVALPGACAHVVAIAGVAVAPVGAADGAEFGAPGTARLRVAPSGATQNVLRAVARRGGAR